MKKHFLFKRILCAILAVTVAMPLFACDGCGDDYDWDDDKTHIVLHSYEAGYGKEWADSLIKRFEEACADVSFEKGRKGVQVRYQGAMKDYTAADIGASGYDVLFMENSNYYDLRNVLVSMEDEIKANDVTLWDGKKLSESIKKVDSNGKAMSVGIGNAEESLWSKLTSQQQDFFTASGNVKVSAIPSYMSTYGIIYDKDLWDEKGFWIEDYNVAQPITAQEFAGHLTDNKDNLCAGPDGKMGTFDDGLPRTYDEFFLLCGAIDTVYSCTPMVWPGHYYDQHLNYLAFNLINNYNGYDQQMLNYTFNGTAKELIKVNADGQLQFTGGVPEIESNVTIAQSNGYDLYRSTAVYYAMTFLNRLWGNNNYFDKDICTPLNVEHTDAQKYFITDGGPNSITGRDDKKPIAMLVDGSWWQREATPAAKIAYREQDYFMNHSYGWLPLPNATVEKYNEKAALAEGEKPFCVVDSLNAFYCINKSRSSAATDGTVAAAKALGIFSCAYDSLVDFTKQTGTLKGVNYEIKEEDMDGLSAFTKSYLTYSNNSTKVYEYSGNPFVNQHWSDFRFTSRLSCKIGGGTTYKTMVEPQKNKTSVTDHMQAIYTAAKSQFVNWNK